MTLALSCLALPFLRFVLPVSVFVSCVNLEKIVLGQPFHAQISRAGPSWSKPPGYCSVKGSFLQLRGQGCLEDMFLLRCQERDSQSSCGGGPTSSKRVTLGRKG